MTPGERITAKKEIAQLLSQQPWGEIDLTLSEHGLPTTDIWNGQGEEYGYIIDMLRDAPEDKLHALHLYVTAATVGVTAGSEPWRSGELRLFMSHLAAHEAFVGQISAILDEWGVSSFVAHVSIEASKEWQAVIETALITCDAMVVFLHEGFNESSWCDQEVGFALARRVPVLPIAIELVPYGFMGKLQAAKCKDDSSSQVAEKILQWLIKTPSAQTAMTEGLVKSFESVYSYDRARTVYGRLRELPTFTPDQLQRLDRASRTNSQIRDANLGSAGIPELVQRLIEERGGSPKSAHDPWDVASIQDDQWNSASEPPF